MKYWDSKGTYQAEFDRFTKDLMPSMGAAETLAGELVRSANRLYYDAYNNGFCNNTSGAIKYLFKYLMPLYPGDTDLQAALAYIKPKTNTGGYSSTGMTTGAALDLIVDRVALVLMTNPELLTQANPCDMFDLQDADYYEEEYDDSY